MIEIVDDAFIVVEMIRYGIEAIKSSGSANKCCRGDREPKTRRSNRELWMVWKLMSVKVCDDLGGLVIS